MSRLDNRLGARRSKMATCIVRSTRVRNMSNDVDVLLENVIKSGIMVIEILKK